MIIEVKVMPASGKNEWVFDKNGRLRCYVKSPPERGLANQDVIKSLAKQLKISIDQIHIISGLTSPNKRLKIDAPLSYQDIVRMLGLEEQQRLI
jgi:uncharacterized protein (TIGR00251 family)